MSGHLTLQDLENDDWGEPTFDSYLVRTVHALRQKPLAEFTTEDLRILVGQAIGLEHLMPLALDHLERDPFAAGHFYPGDLLGVVMAVESAYWRSHQPEAARMGRVAARVGAVLESREETAGIKDHLRALLVAQPWRAA